MLVEYENERMMAGVAEYVLRHSESGGIWMFSPGPCPLPELDARSTDEGLYVPWDVEPSDSVQRISRYRKAHIRWVFSNTEWVRVWRKLEDLDIHVPGPLWRKTTHCSPRIAASRIWKVFEDLGVSLDMPLDKFSVEEFFIDLHESLPDIGERIRRLGTFVISPVQL